MPNEEYQGLLRRPGADLRDRLLTGAATSDRDVLAAVLGRTEDAELPRLISDLGGHDTDSLVRVLNEADTDRSRPAVIFAYTVKGWRLPFAGDPLNHSAMLNTEQIAALAPTLGADADDPWAAFDPRSAEGRLCDRRGSELRRRTTHSTGVLGPVEPPTEVDVRIAAKTSTQQVLGDSLAALARVEGIGRRIVTASPDVSVSTNLGGWINRVGVFSRDRVDRP